MDRLVHLLDELNCHRLILVKVMQRPVGPTLTTWRCGRSRGTHIVDVAVHGIAGLGGGPTWWCGVDEVAVRSHVMMWCCRMFCFSFFAKKSCAREVSNRRPTAGEFRALTTRLTDACCLRCRYFLFVFILTRYINANQHEIVGPIPQVHHDTWQRQVPWFRWDLESWRRRFGDVRQPWWSVPVNADCWHRGRSTGSSPAQRSIDSLDVAPGLGCTSFARGQDVVDVHCGCGATSAERRRLLVRVSQYKFQSLSNIVIAHVDYVHMIFKINCMIFIF
jgi:hypothetical protein